MNKLKQVKNIIITKPQKLDCGKEISNFPISYETYGTLNEKKDNGILVFHALTLVSNFLSKEYAPWDPG